MTDVAVAFSRYNMDMSKKRVDLLMVERGLAESRSLAQRLVMAGQVRADGQIVLKPSSTYEDEVSLEVDGGARFVSRGGEKLAAALEAFPIDIAGKRCCDVGASTGGFTDCLLQSGAAKVYAIDVGHGILHWKLRQDRRVVVMERTNARYVEALDEPVSVVTMDASFISSKILMPVIRNWLEEPADVIVLIKPQFEAGRKEVARGQGVVRDTEIHRQVLSDVLAFVVREGFEIAGLVRSPVLGPKGNVEFLAWFRFPGNGRRLDVDLLIDQALPGDEE